MKNPLSPDQLDLIPDKKPKPVNGTAAVLAAAGLSPEKVARVESIIAAAGPAIPDRTENEWSPNNPDLLVNCQPATQVYTNAYGQLVILQEGRDLDDDPFVRFDPMHVPALIARLQRFVKDGQ